MVAGSGIDLLPVLTRVDRRVPFAEVPGLAVAGVAGHRGEFVYGWAEDVPIVLQNGRLHLYEGLSVEEVTRPVEVLAASGVRSVVFTNAAGALDPRLGPGDLLGVTRVLTWPCVRWPGQPAAMQTDFVVPGCDREGVYMWVHGPSYETPAEIRALRRLGGAVVGMSTAPELWRARRLGLRSAVVSCITNTCLAPQVLTHEHVVETARRSSGKLAEVLRKSVAQVLA